MTSSRTLTTLLLAGILAGTGLAGCFTPGADADEPSFQISRSYAVTLDESRADDLRGADTPDEFVRRLVDASLVVRVAQAGAYTLTYTDKSGLPRTDVLTLEPGAPRAVAGVDPFTSATLLKGAETVASRGPIPGNWWRIGDVPLGMSADAPAEAVYAYRSLASLDLELADITSDDGQGTLESLVARLSLPAVGELSWTLAQDGAEERLDLAAKLRVDDSRGSLAFFEAIGEMQGEPGTAGAEVVSGGASMEGGVSLWLRNDKLVAGKFNGGSVRADPVVYAWSTGAAAEEGEFPCAGKTRADKCTPEEIESVSETEQATEREDFDADEFEADDEEGRDVLRFFERLFAQDMGLYDSLVISATSSKKPTQYDPSEFTVSYLHDLTVSDRADVDLPAGKREAFVIVQTASIDVDVKKMGDRHCERWDADYDCAEWAERTYLRDYRLDETLVRSTLWLDATTFQPLKGDIAAPADIGALVRELVGRMQADAWDDWSIHALQDHNVRLTAKQEGSFEATKLAGNARFAPYVGLLLGGMMAGALPNAMSPAFGATPFVPTPPVYGYDEAVPVPARSISVSQESTAENGAAVLRVHHADGDLYWSDISIRVDEQYRSFAFDADCDGGMDYEFVACSPEGRPETYRDTVSGRDSIRLPGTEPGSTVQILDTRTNTVLLSMKLW